jgi:hypothetical protein
MKTKTKKQIIEFLENQNNSFSYEIISIINNWKSFNDEKFTPNRLAERLSERGKNFSKLGMRDKAKFFHHISIQIF